MTNTFRVTQLVFDEKEDVAEVVAKADAETHRAISELLGSEMKLEEDPDAAYRPIPGTTGKGNQPAMLRETALVRIPRHDAIRLFRAVGKVNGGDEIYRVTHGVYESLRNVMVMLDDEW